MTETHRRLERTGGSSIGWRDCPLQEWTHIPTWNLSCQKEQRHSWCYNQLTERSRRTQHHRQQTPEPAHRCSETTASGADSRPHRSGAAETFTILYFVAGLKYIVLRLCLQLLCPSLRDCKWKMKGGLGCELRISSVEWYIWDIYLMFLSCKIDIKLSQNYAKIHVYTILYKSSQIIFSKYVCDTDGNPVTSILHCHWLMFWWSNTDYTEYNISI